MTRKKAKTPRKASRHAKAAKIRAERPTKVVSAPTSDIRSELESANEQLAASSEILQIISNSPGDLQRVFKIILESATRLCGASFGTLLMYEADGFRRVARHNVPQTLAADAPAGHLKAPFKGAPSLKRLVSTKRLVHIVDIAA
ncbi:MAG: histidine kinase, partial [Hyphomicrobiales bacterium]|nr:histidine kinase [Hyphomicrobiales bacterium]